MKAAELMGLLMNDEAISVFAHHGQIVGLFVRGDRIALPMKINAT